MDAQKLEQLRAMRDAEAATPAAPAPAPTRVTPAPTAQPTPAPDPNFWNPLTTAAWGVDRLNDAIDTVATPVQEAIGVENPVQFGATDIMPTVDRWSRHGVAEIVGGVGSLPAMYDMAPAAIRALAEGGDAPFMEKFGMNLMTDEGQRLLELSTKDTINGKLARVALADNPRQYMKGGIGFAMDMYDLGSDVAGIERDPNSVALSDEVAGIALATLVTLPAGGVGGLNALARTATGRATSTALRTVAKAMEYATPITLTSKPLRDVPINAAVQVGINDVTRGLGGQDTIADEIASYNDTLSDEQVAAGVGAAGVIQSEGEQEVAEEHEPGFYEDLFSGATEEGVVKWGVGGTAAALGLAALRGRISPRQGVRTGVNTRPIDEAGVSSPRDVGAELDTHLADSNAKMVNVVRRASGKEAAETFDAQLKTTTRHGTDATYRQYYDNGVIGDKTTISGSMMDTAYKDLTPQERQLFDMGKTMQNEILNERRGLKPRPGVTTAERDAWVRRSMTNPNVRKMMNMYERVMKDAAIYRHKNGLTDRTQFHDEMTGEGFMHVVDISDSRSTANKLWDAVTLRGKGEKSGDAKLLEREGGTAETLDPMNAYKEYMRDTIETVAHNNARVAFINNTISAPPTAFARGSRVIARGDGPKAGRVDTGHELEVFINGEKRKFRIADSALYNQLKFRPSYSLPIVSDMRRWFQRGTTGTLRPLFSGATLVYDATLGMMSHRVNEGVSGLLDQKVLEGLTAAGLKPFGRTSNNIRRVTSLATNIPDTAMVALEGIMLNTRGMIAQEASLRQLKKLARDIGDDVLNDPAQVKFLRDEMTKANLSFMKSKYGLMQRSGHAPSNLSADMYGAEMSRFEKWLNDTAHNKQFSRVYVGMNNTIRDAYRMGNFSRQVAAMERIKGRGLTAAELQKAAAHTRDIAADPTRAGANKIISGALSVVPYGNIIMQSAVHMIRQMNNPSMYATIASVVAYRVFADAHIENTYGTDGMRYVKEQVPEWEQSMFVFIPKYDNRPPDHQWSRSDFWRIPLGPELGAFTAPLQSVVRSIMDVKTAHEPGAGQMVWQSLGSLVGLSMTPAVNAYTSIFGDGPFNLSNAFEGRDAYPSDTAMGGLNDQRRGVGQDEGLMTDWLANLLYATTGVFGADIADAVERFDTEFTKHDATFFDAAAEGFGTFLYNVEEPFTRTTGYALWSDAHATRDAQGTPVAQKYYDLSDGLARIDAKLKIETRLFSGNSADARDPSAPDVMMLPELINDPKLAQEAMLVSDVLRDPVYKDAVATIRILQRELKLSRNSAKTNPLAVNERMNRINGQLQNQYSIVADEFDAMSGRIAKLTGQKDWSLSDFMDRVEADEAQMSEPMDAATPLRY